MADVRAQYRLLWAKTREMAGKDEFVIDTLWSHWAKTWSEGHPHERDLFEGEPHPLLGVCEEPAEAEIDRAAVGAGPAEDDLSDRPAGRDQPAGASEAPSASASQEGRQDHAKEHVVPETCYAVDIHPRLLNPKR